MGALMSAKNSVDGVSMPGQTTLCKTGRQGIHSFSSLQHPLDTPASLHTVNSLHFPMCSPAALQTSLVVNKLER